MVYRTTAPRHGAVPLRLGAAGTHAVVESRPVHCTHHDAFRFFTAAARRRNAIAPARDGRVDDEQPGACTRRWTWTGVAYAHMRAAVYLRISEDIDGDELGVDRQREDADELLRRQGWTEGARFFVENNTSATRGTRERWEEMMSEVEAGEIDVVIGWTMDRVLRTGRDRLRVLDAGRAHGLVLAPVRGSQMDLATPAGRLVADVLGAVALSEMEQKSDRQRRAARQRAAQGKPWASRRPFGYLTGGAEVNDDEADLIRRAYAEFLAGQPLAGIARDWNAAGVTTTTGRAWRQATVHQLLRNPRNAGVRTYLGEIVGEAKWPAIVDEPTWRAALARLTDPGRRSGGGGGATYLLTGLAVCGLCGATVRKGQRPRDGVAFYRCGVSSHLSRTASHVECFVVAVVLERLGRPDAAALLVDDDRPDAAVLRAEADDIRHRIEALDVEYADGTPGMTAARHRKMNDRMAARLSEVEGRMAHVDRTPLLADLIGAEDVRAVWDALPMHRQRGIIDVLCGVTIGRAARGPRFDPATVEINWR